MDEKDPTETYEVVVSLPLPVRARTEEKRLPSLDVLAKLADMLQRDRSMQQATVKAMPTNPDVDPVVAFDSILLSLQILLANLYDRVLEEGKMSLFFGELCSVRDAIKSMQETAKKLTNGEDMSDQAEEGIRQAVAEGKVRLVTPDNIDLAPVEMLHALAHNVSEKLGITFDCLDHRMDKDGIVAWLKKHAFGIEGKAN
jgi:hypothetical protein